MDKPRSAEAMQLMMSYVTRLGQPLRTFAGRFLPRRNDELGRERGQTVVRIAISLLILVYLISSDISIRPLFIGFIGWSIIVMALTYLDTTSSLVRRTAANVADAGMITYLMITSGEAGIPLFVLYLWITLGNGFRFGLRAMMVSSVLCLTGFSAVLFLSPVWTDLITVSMGVMISLIVLPLYSAHLLHQRAKTTRQAGATNTRTDRPQQHADHTTGKISHALTRERGQAVTRLGVSTVVTIYLIVSHHPIRLIEPWVLFCISYLLFSGLIVILAVMDERHSVFRQTAANVADISAISYVMAATGEMGSPLFILYLWVTLGNGFRFGLRAMAVSSALSVIGFSAVIAASDLWQAQLTLAAGVLVGLVLIPGYAAHLIRQLHLARQRAEEASAAKSLFLARMSHELRTPLNGILGTTELLSANKRFAREDRSLLDVIRDSVKVSMRQIDNVLDFSKIEAGKLQIEQIEFDLHEMLNRTVRLVRSIATDKNLRLMLRIDPATPYQLVGDPHHLQEVLINLLSNAIKFTDKGYVSVDARIVHQTEQSAVICLEVHDTGIGIEPAALERIFEAFSQEEFSTTRRYGGTGLGTTIAKQLVELMAGRMNVTSAKDHGSTFSAEILFARQSTRTESANRLAGMRVLLISKDVTVQDRVALFAQQHDISVQTVATSAEAEGLLRRGMRVGNPIHVVLADSHAVLTCSGAHCADDFLQKTWLSFTPVYLVCDVTPDEAQLRQWGYAGVLSYDLPRTMLFNVMHASAPFDTDAEPGIVRVEPWAWGQSARQRPRLLVVDDNRTNLMIMRKILETANYEIDTAENGERALDMLLRGRYKAAVLDMHMPGLDGIAVIKQYRMMCRGARTPIVMLTANATVDAKLESAEAGADAYLTKPATATTIVSTIEKVLSDTEVHDLARSRPAEPVAQEIPVLDTTLLTELDRLYNNPAGIRQILDEFERECRRLLDDITRAVANRNHAAFCDLLHALKGNGANVGALRLAQTCQEAESYGLLDFRREGEQLLRRLENSLAEAVRALRDFTATGESEPAHGSDLH